MNSAKTLIDKIGTNILNPLIYLMFAVAILVFLWGVFQFVMNLESEDGRKTGAMHMLWGIIGMTIMVGAFGIIAIIKRSIGL